MESGASWAFELHGGETGHPILVKNLDQPRTLLVEVIEAIKLCHGTKFLGL